MEEEIDWERARSSALIMTGLGTIEEEWLLLQFSFSFLIYSLSLSFPIATIGEAIPHLTIAFSFSLAIILSLYLVFSSLIIRLILVENHDFYLQIFYF